MPRETLQDLLAEAQQVIAEIQTLQKDVDAMEGPRSLNRSAARTLRRELLLLQKRAKHGKRRLKQLGRELRQAAPALAPYPDVKRSSERVEGNVGDLIEWVDGVLLNLEGHLVQLRNFLSQPDDD